MINKEQLERMAKETIKKEFDEEMDVEIITYAEMPKRKAEHEKKYDCKINDDFTGMFIPAKNGLNAFMLVVYDEADEFELFEKYHHELQHAIDYFIVMKSLGELPKHFMYYTEFNAGREGFLRVNLATLGMMRTDAERQQFLVGAKQQLIKVLAKTPSTVFDLLCHLARVAALAQIEKKVDYALYEGMPRSIAELAELIYDYGPTKEWYARFKEKIESIPSTNKNSAP